MEPADLPERRIVVQPVHQSLNGPDIQLEGGQESVDDGEPVIGWPGASKLALEEGNQRSDLDAGQDPS